MATASDDARELLAIHGKEVERILDAICRRNLWLGDEADDFRQWAHLRLIEDDHALLRAFAGRSRLTTFLTVVLHNLLRDYRNHRLGRWRPSAAARRLGEVGVKLDTLIHRDRRSLDDSIEILRRNHRVSLSREALASMAASLPPHYPRRHEAVGDADALASPARTDRGVHDAERAQRARRARDVLHQALMTLAPEDRLVIKLRFFESFTIARVARQLGLEQKPLYRRMKRLLGVLKQRLVAAGLTGDDIADMLGTDDDGTAAAIPRLAAHRRDLDRPPTTGSHP